MQKWGLQLFKKLIFSIRNITSIPPNLQTPLTDHFYTFLQHQMTTLQIDLI